VTATPGNASAQVNWNAPADGGSAITGYTVTPYIGTTAQTPTTVSGTALDTTATVNNLTNGTAYTFKVTATNAVGTGPASAASNEVTPAAIVCAPCSFWPSTATPSVPDQGDPNSTEVGVKFKADVNGQIKGIRFYKASTNTGTHIGSLWTSTGTKLASATFASETASGWQQVLFATPVTITAGTVYVASYFAPGGHYAGDSFYFATGVDNGPLHALADGVSGGNALYRYGTSSVFPNNTYNSENYWVDVVFTTGSATAPAAPTGVSATAGNGQAVVSWTAPSNGGSAITSYTVTPFIGSTAQTPTTVSGSPPATTATVTGLTNGTAYTFTVSASNSVGTGPASAASAAVTPAAPTAPAAPTGVSATAGNAQAVVSWTAPSNGGSAITSYTVTPFVGSTAQTPTTVSGSPPATTATVTGLTNGTAYTFTVSATNSVGTGPASAASSAVTPTGATLPAAPTGVSATAGNGQAVVSWTAPSDGGSPITSYTVTPFIGSTAQTPTTVSGSPPATTATVTGLTNGTAYTFTVSATNSVGTGPASAASSAVTPTAPTAPAAPTGVSATAGNAQAVVSWTAPSDGGSPITSYTVTPFIGSTAQTPTTTVSGSPPATTATVTGLTNGTAYTFKVTATNAVGTGPASGASSAVTPLASNCSSCTIWASSATPANPAVADTSAVEVGVKFKADVDGQVTGIRFYKGAGNTGTHIGNLWTSSGTKLASASFAGETASGWQQVSFASPVNITAGTVYVASYFAPVGSYAADSGYFATAGVDNGVLHALQDGVSGGDGVYQYGSTSAFPANTFGSANYWVDVVFATAPATAPATPTGVSATAGDGQAVVSWTAPSSGGSPITSYTVTPFVGSTAQTPTTVSGSPPATTATVTGLTNGTAYTFTVSATNAVGTGPASAASSAVTPAGATAPAAPTGVTAAAGDAQAVVSWTAPSNGGSAITSYTVTPFIGSTAQTPTTVSGSPPATTATVNNLTNGTAYTFTVSATNAVGTGPASAASAAVTPAPVTCAACTIWASSATPANPAIADTSAVEVGVKFTADVDGKITGIRFYKGSGNTGTHIGNLWSATGTKLASATFSGETATGWQQVNFATPVSVTADTVYVASYFAPVGRYAGDSGYFATAGVDNGVLHALQDGDSGGDGVYQYGGASSFPSSSFSSTNYWVDVVFSTGAAALPAAPTGVSATAGDRQAVVSWTAPSNGGSPITSYTVTPFIGSTAQTPTTVSGSPPATTATVTGLTNGTAYTFKVSATNAVGTGPASAASSAVTPTGATAPAAPTGVTAAAGDARAVVSWTAPSNGGSPITSYTVTPFIGSTAQTPTTVSGSPPATTATVTGLTNGTAYTFTVSATNAVGTGPASAASSAVTPASNTCVACTIWASSATPVTPAHADTAAVELGVKFKADVNGKITGIRFYKGSGNSGTHIGNLWSSTGTKLASANFSGETATGWQQVNFATPVNVTAGTVYVASYFAPVGRYAGDGGAFASAGVDNGLLHALRDGVSGGNGVYRYGSTSGFPSNSFNSTNYWVDVVFTTG
jgi:hypothetical protein